ncbi:MAG: efflux RND transporter periplasmic adaptor subunit [Candidatus Eisenbacteria bacterium]
MAPARALVLVALVLVPSLAACAAGCGKNAPAPAARASAVPTGTAAAELVVVAVRPGAGVEGAFQGFLEPVVDAVVPARAAGVVRSVHVKEGDRVARGAALARLEDEEQRLEVEYTSALADQAAAELDRAEKGAAGQFVSRQTLDAARAKARATRADVQLARLAYARRTLRAPVAGIVWQVRAQTHRLVAADDVLFRVSDPSRLRTDLYLPASMAGRVKTGDAVRLTPQSDALSEPLAGRVRTVSPIVDPATGRFRVEVEADGGGRPLAGQSVQAAFAGDAGDAGGGEAIAGDAAVLPNEALLERDPSGLHVWRVKDGVARRVAIELGARRPDGFEVRRGLAAGDLVAARGAVPPVEGAAVRTRLAAARSD